MIGLSVVRLVLAFVFCQEALCARNAFINISTWQKELRSSAPLSLTDDSYSKLTSAPRNHTTIILLTALSARYGCHVCKEFQPEWELLAKNWVKQDREGQTRTILGTLDFDNGKGTFQKMMLQTAPVLLAFRPTTAGSYLDAQPARYDFIAGSQNAEQIVSWLSRQMPDAKLPSIQRSLNYSRILTSVIVGLGAICVLIIAWSSIVPVIQSRTLWAGISLVSILLFISGQMFNHIRKVPYITGNDQGGMTYLVPGFSNQLGMETQIVAAMYGVLSISVIALSLRIPRIQSPKSQLVAITIWASIMFGTYGFFISIFRIKNGGYPFYLPPF